MDHLPSDTIAAFDLDGTLTRSDTLLPFLGRVLGRNPMRRLLARHARSIALMQVGLRDREEAKVALLRDALGGRLAAEVEPVAEAFAAEVVGEGLRSDIVAIARQHLDAGHSVVVISASPALYVAKIAGLLGIDATLATELEVDGDGRFTGGLVGANCRGSEKVRRLESWLDGRAGHLCAYGDSAGDRELLARCDTGTYVGRRPRRRAVST